MLLPDNLRGFLVDMDGTLYLSDHLLPGSLEFLAFTRERAVPLLLLSNNSSKNRQAYVDKLARMGVTVDPAQIFTSAEATAQYMQTITQPGAHLAVFGTPELEQTFRTAGFVLDMDMPEYVVLGFDMTIDYAKLTRLCDLVRAGLPYIATHPDFNCPVAGGFIPDIGAMMAFVEASTGRKADIVIGKPNHTILDMAAARLDLPLDSLCMVGDRLYTDIAMGHGTPVRTVLVLSGETTLADLDGSPFQPDAVVQNLGELTERLQSGAPVFTRVRGAR